jgi:hypothetical protein
MTQFTLTNHGLMALGIYIGYKAPFRRAEMESFGVDYETACEEFRKVGLMKGRKMDLPLARNAFKERSPSGAGLGSQTHMYCKQLGFERKSFY